MSLTVEPRRQSDERTATTRVVEISDQPQSVLAVPAEVWEARRLFWNLVERNLKGRYRGAALGNWWILIRPIIEMLPYFLVFSIFLKVSTDPLPYIVYLLSGFGPWQVFGGQLNAAPMSMAKMRSVVDKIYFPRLIVPLTELTTRLLDYAIILVAVVIVALAFGIKPFGALWALPFFTLLLMMFSFGAGLIVTTICTWRPDLTHGVPAATRIVFYASAVIYPLTIVPEQFRFWLELNPLTTIISGVRWSLFGYYEPSGLAVAFASVCAIGVLWLGLTMFLRVERQFSDLL